MKKLLALVAALFAAPALEASPTAAQTLPEMLADLDAVLAEKRPDYAALLRPPLTAAQIGALEEEYATTLPDEVKALYAWHDGQDRETGSAEMDEFHLLDDVLPPEERAFTAAGPAQPLN